VRSLFWRVFASFWLAIALVAGLSWLLGHALNQDTWIISRHPGLKDLASEWVQLRETKGELASYSRLERLRRAYRIDVQVLGENGQLLQSTFPARAAAYEARQPNKRSLPWRRLTSEYTSPGSNETYLFIYRVPRPELDAWHRGSLFWPVSALSIALVVIGLLSLLLTLSITRPLSRLRGAVHDLGQTSYQQHSLDRLAARKDEFGTLARDFNRMGARLQDLISSQRQLLRDVSHELRSPLARLQVALALAERAEKEERDKLWPRLNRECERLDALIGEILALARLDADLGSAQSIDLVALLDSVRGNAHLAAPEQLLGTALETRRAPAGWPDMLERALDNLLRNALRFNPQGMPIEIAAREQDGNLLLSVRDHGPGVAPELLARLGEPFFRAPGQSAAGYGLGLAIARRAAERHGGRLLLANHPEGGFIATLELPLEQVATGV